MNELYTKANELKELIGTEELLDALIQAMSHDELKENLEYIDRMHDTQVF